MSDFTHFNDQGRAKMVDVGEKNITRRTATAMAFSSSLASMVIPSVFCY